MKCIGYDAEWVAELIEDYPVWKKRVFSEERAIEASENCKEDSYEEKI